MTKFSGVVTADPGEKVFDPLKAEREQRTVNQWGASRKHIFAAVRASLARLQLEYVDVLQIHRVGSGTPFEETMEALHDVVKAGYARYIGISSCWAWKFQAMQNYALSRGLTPFISMQDHHSLIYREEEREMFPALKLLGVSAIPWSPLARGLLCKPFKESLAKSTKRGEGDWFLANYTKEPGSGLEEIINRVEEVAKKRGVSMAQVAVAWSLSKDVIAAAVVGTTSLANLKDILEGVHLQLTEEEIKYLEEPYRPMNIIGHV
ncbi:NADP-dependent oxidoreductase domain-containing protein [Fomitopsis serialis]|uniref:NADP-dependent oxidoreductase domain-containing protein n=1 Tax=Fomitopsis serialis TaxID=139415 RepID=UPI0020081666|nr:NADP-dependent oxidoreductase domain-containing protein [Neoantrodia serialis]KAH9915536.1 NADP-dependent oxidoreductase domain-containing protein [Neoantrodia serialis]